jgi:hypothetical protein
MKDQAFSLSSDLTAPHPLSRLQVDSLSQSACVSLVELTDERGGGTLSIAWSSWRKLLNTLWVYVVVKSIYGNFCSTSSCNSRCETDTEEYELISRL